MSYRLETVNDEIAITGYQVIIDGHMAHEAVPEFWGGQLSEQGHLKVLGDIKGQESYSQMNALLGVYRKASIEDESLYYLIGVRCDVDKMAAKNHNGGVPLMTEMTIEPGKWVVFTGLSEARKRLMSEWIPTLGYTIDDKPFLECIFGPNQDTDMELWVPIVG